MTGIVIQFLLATRSFFFQMFWLALGPIQLPIGHHMLSLELNRPGHEADCATPSSAIINNACNYNFSTSAYAFMSCTGMISPLQDLTFSHQCGWRFTLSRMKWYQRTLPSPCTPRQQEAILSMQKTVMMVL